MRTDKKQSAAKQLGFCQDASLRPFLGELKKLTRNCVELAHTLHRVASGARIRYNSLIVLGMIGGSAVLAAPVFSVVKIPDTTFDPGIALTVIGASVSAVALLWIQVGQPGDISNKTFKKYTDLIRLLQNAEIEWQNKVCRGDNRKVAQLNATIILKGLAQQCVKEVPKVDINPELFKKISEQQNGVSSILTKYQQVSDHMEQRKEREESRQHLKALIKKLQRTQAKLQSATGEDAIQLKQTLESLCAQAKSEHKRLQSLRQKPKQAQGSWSGICRSLKVYEKHAQQRSIAKAYKESQQELKRLRKRIALHRQKIERSKEDKARTTSKRILKLVCAQALQEHSRMSALWAQLHSQPSTKTPPGSWRGTCRVYSTNTP